jgi:NADH:ubiquinone oxidoreductase subunit H
LIVVPILIDVAYFSLVERKILGTIQRRRGPNAIGFFGLLQPLSDGFKLLVKEVLLPSSSNKILFVIAPFITFVLSLIN